MGRNAQAEIYTYTNLSDDEYTFLVQDDDVTVLEHTVEQEMSMDEQGVEVQTPVHSAKVRVERHMLVV